MIKAMPLEQHHLDELAANMQEAQAEFARQLIEEKGGAAMITSAGPAAAFLHEDKVVAIASLVDIQGTDRAILVCAFAKDVKRCFVPLFKTMRRVLRMYPRRRYEAYIDPRLPFTQRFARLGGFSFEGIMRSFEIDGSDRELWALVRGK